MAEHIVTINITTEEHDVEIKETNILVSEKNAPIGETGHDHDDRYYTKEIIDEKLELIEEKFVAGEVTNGHRWLYLKDELAFKADRTNIECYNKVLGMSMNAALEFEDVRVRKSGKVHQSGWGLVPNTLYYLGTNGQMTPYEVAEGLGLCVGYSISEDDFIINIKEDIIYD
jgi:glucan-binding YG repeat protein